MVTTLLLVLVSVASFGLGRVSALQGFPWDEGQNTAAITPIPVSIDPLEIKAVQAVGTVESGVVSEVAPPAETPVSAKQYVGSRNGTKYHLPWCAGAKQIKEENKVWFGTKGEAEKAGYAPASNCKGI